MSQIEELKNACSRAKANQQNNTAILESIGQIEKECELIEKEHSIDDFQSDYLSQLNMILTTPNEKAQSNFTKIYNIIVNKEYNWDAWAELFTGLSLVSFGVEIGNSQKRLLNPLTSIFSHLGNIVSKNEQTVNILTSVANVLKKVLKNQMEYQQNNAFVSSPIYLQIIQSVNNGNSIGQYKHLLSKEKGARITEVSKQIALRDEETGAIISCLSLL